VWMIRRTFTRESVIETPPCNRWPELMLF
jgi:hypothetical protein